MSLENLVKKVKLYTYEEFKKTGKLDMLLNKMDLYDGEGYVALIEDDVYIEGSLDVDAFFYKIADEFNGDKYKFGDGYLEAPELIIFEGNVKIENALYVKETENYSTSIVFEGNFQSNSVILGGTDVAFFGDVMIEQVLYTQIHTEGVLYIDQANSKNINVEVDINQYYKKDGISYDFSEMSEELTAENLDKIFIDKEEFFDFDDEEGLYFDIELCDTEDKLINALVEGREVFKK